MTGAGGSNQSLFGFGEFLDTLNVFTITNAGLVTNTGPARTVNVTYQINFTAINGTLQFWMIKNYVSGFPPPSTTSVVRLGANANGMNVATSVALTENIILATNDNVQLAGLSSVTVAAPGVVFNSVYISIQ